MMRSATTEERGNAGNAIKDWENGTREYFSENKKRGVLGSV